MPLYENVFIARQELSSAQVEALTESLSGVINDNGGTVTKTEHWGLRSLAYRINKNRKGHYVLFNLDAPADAVQEMERNMRINEDLLRYLTIRVDELEEGPSVQMQSRGRDRDSGRKGDRYRDRDRDRDRGRGRDRDDEKPKQAAEDGEKPEKAEDGKKAEDGSKTEDAIPEASAATGEDK